MRSVTHIIYVLKLDKNLFDFSESSIKASSDIDIYDEKRYYVYIDCYKEGN